MVPKFYNPIVREHVQPLAWWGVSLIGLITANQEQALFWGQMAGYIVTVLSGAIMFWSIQRKRREDLVIRLAKEHIEQIAQIRAELILEQHRARRRNRALNPYSRNR